jgi:hypothetical protein
MVVVAVGGNTHPHIHKTHIHHTRLDTNNIHYTSKLVDVPIFTVKLAVT